jgi:para-nitrobenzyl esterase
MSYRNTRKAFALRRAVAGLLLAACALLPVPAGPASAATCSAEENVVCTHVGAVRGVREGQTVGFKGIPYAKPPLAALRWRPPEPPAAWDGVRDGSRTGPMCPQIVGGKVVGDEDCLTLNIWAPARPAERPRAVMVWLTGGGNHSLSGQGSPGFGGVTYDGEVLAGRGDVIFVSFKVRLGVLGFLAHPALSAERPERVSGNYASLDQIAMLNWLNRNIAAFGGDPSRVFLFGTSAGGGNICALMTSPMTNGLFHGAAMQSSVPAACELQTLAEVERGTGARVVKAAGCDQAGDVAGCLRTKSVEEIVSAVPGTFGIFPRIYGPNVDGHVFPDQPIKLIAAKRHHAMPAIVGGTADETMQFVNAAGPVTDETTYAGAVGKVFGAAARDAILARYPAGSYEAPRRAFVQLTTDAFFTCVSRRVASALAAAQAQPVYRYHFTHLLENDPAESANGSVHTVEHPYFFAWRGKYRPSAADLAVQDALVGYWTRMAKIGDPNGDGAPNWPAVAKDGGSYLEIGKRVAAGHGPDAAQCDFWDAVALPWPHL